MIIRRSLLAVVLAVAVVGCQPKTVAPGKTVKIDYTLTVDGQVVDTSIGKQPLPYVHGSGQILPALEEQLVGLKVGDKKQVTLPPEKGYGPINPKALQTVPRKMFGDASKLKVGMIVNGGQGAQRMQARVVKIGKKDITLDMNHPLAGKTLNFDVAIVEIANTPKEDAAPAQAPAPAAPTNS